MSALGDEEAAAQQRCPACGADLPCLKHYALRTVARVAPGQGAQPTLTRPTLTRIGRRVERTGEPGAQSPEPRGPDGGSLLSPPASRLSPRLRAIDWHRTWLRALASVEDKEAQDAAGDFHMKRLAQYLREEREEREGRP